MDFYDAVVQFLWSHVLMCFRIFETLIFIISLYVFHNMYLVNEFVCEILFSIFIQMYTQHG